MNWFKISNGCCEHYVNLDNVTSLSYSEDKPQIVVCFTGEELDTPFEADSSTIKRLKTILYEESR